MTKRWWLWLIFVFLAFPTPLLRAADCTIQTVVLKSLPQADLIVVKANSPIPRWRDFTLDDPKRVAVDLFDCDYRGGARPDIRKGQYVDLLRIGRHVGKVRIAANLLEDVDMERRVVRKGNDLFIYIGQPPLSLENGLVTDHPAHPDQSRGEKQTPKDSFAEETTPQPLSEDVASAPDLSDDNDLFKDKDFYEDTAGEAKDPFEFPEEGSAFEKDGFGDGLDVPWENDEFEKSSPFRFGGRLWNKFSQNIKDDGPYEDKPYNHVELRLTSEYVPHDRFQAVLSVEADHFMYRKNHDWDYDHDIRVHDAYIALSGNAFKLQAGNQIVKWGKADEISPLDNINPQDFRDGPVREREDRKMPTPLLNVEWYKGMSKLQGLFIPFFQESKLDFVGRNWAFLDHYDETWTFQIRENDYPNTLSNAGAGTRFSGTVGNVDYALSYLYQRSNIPYVDSLQTYGSIPAPGAISDLPRYAAATGQPIVFTYERQSVAGFEFETTWRDFGLRGDLAYIHKQSFTTAQLEHIQKPVFQCVLGADYNGPNALYVNFQFSQEMVQNFDDDIAFAKEFTSAINGEITKGILDNYVELEFRYYYNISRDDYYWSPAVVLKYWKNLTLELGAEIVGGPDDTILGVFEDNDQFYGIVQIDF